MTMHSQEWAKVNVPVDDGIRGLVEALSCFPGLETIESCEGSDGEPAWVCFRYGRYWEAPEPWRELTEFAFGYLHPRLANTVGDAATVTLRAQPSGLVLADLSVRKEALDQVESSLRDLAREYQRLPTP